MQHPLAAVVFGGLATSTLLSLFARHAVYDRFMERAPRREVTP